MHPVIAAGLAAELDRLAAAVRRDWAWPSPTAGFADWLVRQHGMPAFFTPPGTADRDRLHEAPVLAAHGYLLSAVDGATAAGSGHGAQRLRGCATATRCRATGPPSSSGPPNCSASP